MFYRQGIERIPLDVPGVLRLVISFLPALAVVQLVHLAFAGRRVALVTANCVVVGVYGLLLAFHLDVRTGFDFAVLAANFQELFYGECFGLVLGGMGKIAVPALAVCLGGLVVLERRIRLFSRWRMPGRFRVRLLSSLVVLTGCALLRPAYPEDEVVSFVRSVSRYYFPKIEDTVSADRLRSMPRYPYVKQPAGAASVPLSPPDRPHVFLVALESFSAKYVERKSAAGEAFTPVFNETIKRGVFVDHFYGNSVQTARGHLALLCSILPSIRKKVFVSYPALNLHCLPEILAQNGYDTLCITGHTNLSFDNTGAAMKKLGFATVKAMDQEFGADVAAASRVTWGVRDSVLYQKVFGLLDRREQEQHRAGSHAPYFVFIATIANHTRFDEVPPAERRFYPAPRTDAESYANSVFVMDRDLRQLFAHLEARPYLRNSLVIFTGDHSFPTGEHGNYYNVVSAYEENFRIPLLMLWEGQLSPRRLRSGAYSQIDVAPTILALLRISATTHFIGQPLVAGGDLRPEPVYLSQPYDGTYLVSVRYPWKYVRHLRLDRELLYNLETDPRESRNLAGDPQGRAWLPRLREDISFIHLNQRLIESNRIWPAR